MKLSIKLNLNILVSTTFSEVFYLDFTNITDLNNWYADENVTELEFNQESYSKRMYVFLDDDDSPTYDEQDGDIVNLSENGEYITFTCEISNSSYARVLDFINKGIIEVNQEGKTTLFVYRLNDEKEHINKNLTYVDSLEGSFKAPLGIKNIEIDVINYDINNSYNYVYIPKLNRYYYITNIQLMNKDYTRLILQEDVLMSWKTLIGQQEALITRYGGASDHTLYDDRFPLKDIPTVSYNTPTNVAGADVKELKYIM